MTRSAAAGWAAAGALIAPAARRWLTGLTTGRVLHVFEAAAYLVDQSDGVLLLARPPVGPGPFSLVMESPGFDLQEVLTVGEGVSSSSGNLVAERWRVDATAAREWNPLPDWESLRRREVPWREGVRVIRQALMEQGPRGPFGRLLADPSDPTQVDPIEARLEERARGGAERLAAALAGRSGELAAASAQLAGLGSGFTPSGDDFLLGTMLAQWATRPAAEARRLCRTIAGAAYRRTTTASAAWLGAAARGEASGPWHALVDSLAAGDAERLAQHARDILETGHTSGEDALAGFLRSIQPRP